MALDYEGTRIIDPKKKTFFSPAAQSIEQGLQKKNPKVSLTTAQIPLGAKNGPDPYQALKRLESEAIAAGGGKMGWQTRRALMGKYADLAGTQMRGKSAERLAEAGYEADFARTKLKHQQGLTKLGRQQAFMGGQAALGREHDVATRGEKFTQAKALAGIGQKYKMKQLERKSELAEEADVRDVQGRLITSGYYDEEAAESAYPVAGTSFQGLQRPSKKKPFKHIKGAVLADIEGAQRQEPSRVFDPSTGREYPIDMITPEQRTAYDDMRKSSDEELREFTEWKKQRAK